MSDFAHRWELRREPDNGTVIVSFIGDTATWRPFEPIIGQVRWYRDGVPFGPILIDGSSARRVREEQLPSGGTITTIDWME
jgi:hypothetical protein